MIEELTIRLSLWYKPSNQTPSNLPSSDTSSLCHCGVEASSGRLLSYVILTIARAGRERVDRNTVHCPVTEGKESEMNSWEQMARYSPLRVRTMEMRSGPYSFHTRARLVIHFEGGLPGNAEKVALSEECIHPIDLDLELTPPRTLTK